MRINIQDFPVKIIQRFKNILDYKGLRPLDTIRETKIPQLKLF